jgi:hypothetical protein
MGAVKILGFSFFALLAVGGLVSANGLTGNVVSNTPVLSHSWPGYIISIIGLAGFFVMLAMNKKEEEMY